ncbi:MAG: SDR family NAD(P)-dependent oxidoreductase [Myxococcota bacterium]
MKWAGKRVVITGGASGLGFAIAKAVAGKGASLVLTDVRADALSAAAGQLEATGAQVQTAVVDVSDSEAVAAFAAQAADDGPVDMVVNNAGVAVGGVLADTPPKDWDWVVSVNLLGVAYGSHAFIPALRRDGGGVLVNIASASAFGGVPGLGAYEATKAAVLSLSETLEAELRADHIQVHCVCPGFVPTGLMDEARFSSDVPDVRDKARRALFPEGRHPDQVAAALLKAIDRKRFLVTVYPEGHAGRWFRGAPEWIRGDLRQRILRKISGVVGSE